MPFIQLGAEVDARIIESNHQFLPLVFNGSSWPMAAIPVLLRACLGDDAGPSQQVKDFVSIDPFSGPSL
jgi:hypothetical protein